MTEVDALRQEVEQLTQELEIVRGNRDSILREKRALEGRLVVDAAEVRNNPQQYRRLKEQARQQGLELAFEDSSRRAQEALPDRYETDDTLFVSKPHVGRGVDRYRELRTEAQNAGKRLVIVSDAKQLPPEALS